MFYTLNTSADDSTEFYDGFRLVLNNITSRDFGKTNLTIYNGTLGRGINDSASGNYTNFLVMANVTIWTTAKYTGTVVLDGNTPVPTITAPADTSIGPQESITYSCTATDAASGIVRCTTTLTKPDSSTVQKTSSSCADQTFNNIETGDAGTYSVGCTATDNVGFTSSSTTSSFTVMASTGGGSSGGGGGGDGSSTVTEQKIDVDLTNTQGTQLSGKQGSVKTIAIGSQTHKIILSQVEEARVTFTVQSEPLNFTLTIGETKAVDLNNDTINDITITLKSIAGDTVFYDITKITAGANAIIQEETPPEKEQEPTILPEEDVPDNNIIDYTRDRKNLLTWVITAGVIALIILGYILIKRRE